MTAEKLFELACVGDTETRRHLRNFTGTDSI